MFKSVRFSLLFIALCGVFFIQSSSAQFLAFENPLIGKPAPDFTLKVAGGKKTNFTKYRDGDTAIVFFWATWCPHCRVQLLEMDAEFEMFEKKNIKLAYVDLGEKEMIVARYMKKKGVQAPIFLDTKSTLEDTYQIMGVPTFFFVNTDGIVTAVKHSLPENFEAFLNKKM